MAFKRPKHISGSDLGFGTIATINNQRMINPDGSSNIRRKGLPIFRSADTYNHLITMKWSKFWLIILCCYLIINTLFAVIYLWAGIENLSGTQGHTTFEHFFDAFFFSAQTISTVGYGHISPSGILTSSIAAFESMMGLLTFALATGLLYGRFSRPSARIIYSKNILVTPFRGSKALMCRLANYRRNQLIELEVALLMSMNEYEGNAKVRKFYPLTLERSKINFLSLSWTIVHPIDENSPLFNLSAENLDKTDTEFLLTLKAFDDTFSETVHSRTSYTNEQIVWNAKFSPAFAPDDDGVIAIDLSKISLHEKL